MKPTTKSMFHFRHYRYVRMMLRRFPKMRAERLAISSGPGIDAICGNTFEERARAASERTRRKMKDYR